MREPPDPVAPSRVLSPVRSLTASPPNLRHGAFALALCATLAPPAFAAPKGADSSALRRACATGALTAYACAQRGVHTSGAAPAPAPPVVKAPPPSPVAASPPPAPPPVTSPTGGRRPRGTEVAGAPAVRPYQDTRKRYSLEIPEGWELRLQGGFAALAHGADWIQLRSAPVPTAAAPEAAGAAGLEMLRAEYAQIRTVSDTPQEVGGRPGRRLTLTARSRGGRPSALVVVAAPMPSGEVLVVLAGGAPESASAVEAGVAALVRTVRFR